MSALKGRKRVTFEASAKPGHDVYVAGTFNDWDPKCRPMKPVDNQGRYRATLVLPPGRYEYKFVVDGRWHLDSANPRWVPNAIGSLNSVVELT